jgi:hypothetical protein
MEKLQRHYYWQGMYAAVREYVRSCPQCQMNKASNQAPQGLSKPLSIPDAPFSSVAHDLITDLPRTARGHDAIATFTCRLTKRARFVPTTKSVDAAGYAQLFFDNIYRDFGLPTELVSDRDPRFTSKFWQALMELAQVQTSMSTPYHPQTDGQSERTNRTLEDMLRAYVAPDNRDWDQHLPLVEFAYNDSVQASTGYTPFFLSQGWHPRSPLALLAAQPDAPTTSRAPAADQLIGTAQQIISAAKANIAAAQRRMQHYHNLSHRHVEYAVGDMVLLSTADLSHPPGTSPKLLPRWTGPFQITAVVTPHLAFRLAIPDTLNIHPVTHVSRIRKFVSSEQFPRDAFNRPAPSYSRSGQHFWEVASLLRHYPVRATSHADTTHYLVAWQGYPPWENTKEPAAQIMEDVPDLVQQYWANRSAQPPTQRAPPAQRQQAAQAVPAAVQEHPPAPTSPAPPQGDSPAYRTRSRST